MAEAKKKVRLVNVAKELNLGISTIADYLNTQGFEVEAKPTNKLTEEMYNVLLREFQQDKAIKEESEQINLGRAKETPKDQEVSTKSEKSVESEEILIKNLGASSSDESSKNKISGPTVVGKIDLDSLKKKPKAKEQPQEEEKKEEVKKPEDTEVKAPKQPEKEEEKEEVVEETKKQKISGPTIVGKIDLPVEEPRKKKPVASSSSVGDGQKRKRKRKVIVRPGANQSNNNRKDKKGGRPNKRQDEPQQISEKEVEEKLKATLAKLGGGTPKGKGAKAKQRRLRRENEEAESQNQQQENKIQVTEFISVKDLASLLDVPYTEIIGACMKLGIIVSINQRLDAETIEIVADEFNYTAEFVGVDEQDEEEEIVDALEDLAPRPPVVTIMGHVDHGKTSLLDYIRKENVIAGEAGGITQHIGAYSVELDEGRKIAFLDTPGHEAFTAMRARGAQVTDIVVIVIAADDQVMPQTKEAISHAQAAGVPMIFAYNKIDKEGANPDKIREQLANMDILVEEWGGKYQSQEISAKKGLHIGELLEKILLEAEMLDLKANPNRNAEGSVIEASLDKGRGYVATFLNEKGTLRIGDLLLCGQYYGKVKALYNERLEPVKQIGPAMPAQVLGLNGAPQAGDKYKVMNNEQEVKQISNKREQIAREQGVRTQKHITLDEIGRRIALGNFKELNLMVKGDVDGSVEALSDSLQKLSVEEISINIIQKSVGQITESDVLLASASDAILIGFQVRPSVNARKLAEKEGVEIRLYSVIYDAIDHIKGAMEGMLDARIEEQIVGNIEVRETFKISKVGTIAGCYVLDGKVKRDTRIRVIRDGVVIYSGELESLKRFKDDVKEVVSGYECGLNIKNYNDIKVGDVIEGYEEVEIKRTLKDATK